MADDFTGVPSDQWHQVRARVDTYAWVFWMLAGLFGLLVLRLIDKGVLAGWADLFRPVSPAGG